MLALPIFTASRPATIVGADELNFCVRDGNRCTLTAINTNYLSVFRLLPENIHHYTTARLPCQELSPLKSLVTRTGFEPMLTA